MSKNQKSTSQIQAKAQHESPINLVSEGCLEDYKLEKQLQQELNDQRIKIQTLKIEIHSQIERLQKTQESLKNQMKQTILRLQEIRKKQINTQNQQIKTTLSHVQGREKGQQNNKQEQPINVKKEIETEQAKGLKNSQQQNKSEQQFCDFKQKKQTKGDEKYSKEKERIKTDIKKNFERVGEEKFHIQEKSPSLIEWSTQTDCSQLGYKRLKTFQIQCKITENTLCLINHLIIEKYIQEYQSILYLLFTKTYLSNTLSLKCVCGKKLCQSHISEPRNMILFQSIMEKQLDALIGTRPHLKCQNISCNYKSFYDAKIGQLQSHYYCPMCNEKCPFIFLFK